MINAKTCLAGAATVVVLAGLVAVPTAASVAAPGEGSVAADPGRGAAATPDVIVEPQVRDALAAEQTAVVWVYLQDTADLAAAASITDRADQGWFVLEELTATAEQSQAGLLAMLDKQGVQYESFWIANTVQVMAADAELVEQIAARPDVERIAADRTYHIPEPVPASDEPRVQAVEWNIDRIGAPRVWDELETTGEGIVVGSIDTGVQFDHPALAARYRGNTGDGGFDHNYNWWDPSSVCGSPSLVPCDNQGHGTHTMGTMVGDDGVSNQIGVAPGARWITAKGCETTTCSQSALLSSGQFILAPTDLNGEHKNPELRPHIVNNSWGGDPDTDPWYVQTVRAWVSAGIFPQFSSGNSGPSCGTAGNPGNLAESYSAGAFDINDNLYTNSSRGPSAWDDQLVKPNIAAPGVSVRSSVPGNGYAANTGTSMASPHVAGTVALMWSVAPSLVREIDATRALLDGTAIDTEDLSCGGTPENNNVWGQGRLDAYAAVAESPRGPVGILVGIVTDATDDTPIAGATVTIAGPADRQRTTGADGTYTVVLPVGDYTVTASAFGYDGEAAPVTVTEDQTTTRGFTLQPVPRVTISGQVTDGSGHGWPLYARVHAAGTPVSTFTNPLTGRYRVDLPVNDAYTLEVEAQYPGYAAATQTIDVAESDQELNLELVADSCQAPGYLFSGEIGVLGDTNDQLTDFLDDQGVPSSVFNWGDDPSEYDAIIINAPFGPGQQPFLDFLAETDAAGTGVVFLDTLPDTLFTGIRLLVDYVGNPTTRGAGRDTSKFPHLSYRVLAEHPILDGAAVGDEIIFSTTGPRDHAWFFNYEGEGRQVIADREVAGSPITPAPGIGVHERANNRHVLMSMHGVSTRMSPDDWTDDGRQLLVNALEWAAGTSLECVAVDGGLVVGDVGDLNTGAAVTGATVVSDDDPADRGQSVATPDDPALDDGFYWLFSSQTGSRQFTAAARNYASAAQPVDVVADAAAEANFVLAAGQLAIEPADVAATTRLGQSADRTVTISNTGTAPAQIVMSERSGSFRILGGATAGGSKVRNIKGDVTPAASSDAEVAVAPAQEGLFAPPWEPVASYPVSIMDNAATELDGLIYSFGGFTPDGVTADAYVYDPGADEWAPIASLPAPRRKPEVVAVGGLIYILGGWDGVGGTSATVLVYDPAADSYEQVAPMPAGRAAPGVTVLNGQIYVVGGCTTVECPTSRTAWRYDPGLDRWETLPAYPEPTSWLACAGVETQVVCAGGTDGMVARASTWSLEPGSDGWEQRASMPYDNWAMAYAAANGRLVVSAGVTDGFTTITNRSAAYDPILDEWSEIEPANVPRYRMASACGFYKLGGSVSGLTPSTDAEVHPDYADCDLEVDVPWLQLGPLTATLAPGDSVTVTVSVDSAAEEVDQPGAYTAGIGIRHDTPYPVEPVGVTMDVTPPNNWGKLAGTVVEVGCQGDESPIAGAIVQIDGRQLNVTLSTAADGSYTRWMAVNNNPLQLTAASGVHAPQTRAVRIKPRQTVVEDFALQRICSGAP